MKVNLICGDKVIETGLHRNMKVKEIINCLKNSEIYKTIANKDSELLIMDEAANFIDDEEMIRFEERSQKSFYLVSKPIYKRGTEKTIPTVDLEDTIMKVTGAKTKLKKEAKKRFNQDSLQDRFQLLEQMTNSLGILQTNNPLLQNRVSEINHFRDLLRSMMVEMPHRVQVQSTQPVVPDENMLAQLKDMGFPEESCRRALIMSRNNISRATDVLINDELDYIPGEK